MKLAIEESVLRQVLDALRFIEYREKDRTPLRVQEAITELRAALDAAEKVEWMVTFRRNSPSIDRLVVSSKDRAYSEVAPHLIESVVPVVIRSAPAVPERIEQ